MGRERVFYFKKGDTGYYKKKDSGEVVYCLVLCCVKKGTKIVHGYRLDAVMYKMKMDGILHEDMFRCGAGSITRVKGFGSDGYIVIADHVNSSSPRTKIEFVPHWRLSTERWLDTIRIKDFENRPDSQFIQIGFNERIKERKIASKSKGKRKTSKSELGTSGLGNW